MRPLALWGFLVVLAFSVLGCSDDETPASPPSGPKPTGQIVFQSDRDGDYEIFIMSAGGGAPISLGSR